MWTHALVEFSVAAASHGRVVSPVHFSYVVAFDVGDLVHGQVSSKGHLAGRVKDNSRSYGQMTP